MKKKYREDLNRHISQKMNEFASLALAGRYPLSIVENTLALTLKVVRFSV